MTNHPDPSSAPPDLTDACMVSRACVHIDAAAGQLRAAAEGDVFSPLLSLAAQLSLIRGGIEPAIRAAVDPDDRLGPIAHVDRALSLLDAVPPPAGATDLLLWTLRLAETRDALPDAPAAAWAARP